VCLLVPSMSNMRPTARLQASSSRPPIRCQDMLETVAAHAIVHEVVARCAGGIQRVEVNQFGAQFNLV